MKDESFKDFILDQLDTVTGVVARKMFGGFGLYSEGIFFGIISSDVLYFKTDSTTRQKYLDTGMDCFHASEEQVLKNYFEVPANVLEDRDELHDWALEAIHMSDRNKKDKTVH